MQQLRGLAIWVGNNTILSRPHPLLNHVYIQHLCVGVVPEMSRPADEINKVSPVQWRTLKVLQGHLQNGFLNFHMIQVSGDRSIVKFGQSVGIHKFTLIFGTVAEWPLCHDQQQLTLYMLRYNYITQLLHTHIICVTYIRMFFTLQPGSLFESD